MPAPLTPLEQAIAKALAAALVREIRVEFVRQEPDGAMSQAPRGSNQ